MSTDTIRLKDAVEIKATPAQALPAPSNWWRLFYKRGGNPRCELIFHYPGSIQDAIKRGRSYCLSMNYIFIHVELFLHDLDEDEKQYAAGG